MQIHGNSVMQSQPVYIDTCTPHPSDLLYFVLTTGSSRYIQQVFLPTAECLAVRILMYNRLNITLYMYMC